MDPQEPTEGGERETPQGDPALVANAAEAALLVAADQGLPVAMAEKLALTFSPDGGVKVEVTSAGDTQSVEVSAADVAARSDYDEEPESIPPPADAG